MEYDQLKGFYYVAKCGSFTEAAGRLYLTQPAISLQVKALEKELGEQLFERRGRTIRLTPAGEILLREAAEVVGKLEEVQRLVDDLKSLDRGRLSLGASDTTSIHLLPDLVGSFVREHPGIEVTIASTFSSGVVERVLGRTVDIGIATMPVNDDRLEVLPLFEQRLCCIVAPTHALANRRKVSFSALRKERFIMLEPGSATKRLIVEGLEGAGVSTIGAMELSNFEIIKRYVEIGLGVSLIPETAVDSSRDRLAVVPLSKRLVIRSAVVHRKDKRLSHAARAFLESAQQFFHARSAKTAGAGTTNN